MSNKCFLPILTTALLMISCLSCHCGAEGDTQLPREVSLEEAGEIFGLEIPIPSYLPEGYEIEEIILATDSEVVKVLRLSISNGSNCPIYLGIQWGGIPHTKLTPPDFHKVQLGENAVGWWSEHMGEKSIRWNWNLPDEPGYWVMRLSACKELPIREMISIARSVGW